MEGRKTRRSLAKKMGDYGWEIDDGLGQPKELVVGKGEAKGGRLRLDSLEIGRED